MVGDRTMKTSNFLTVSCDPPKVYMCKELRWAARYGGLDDATRQSEPDCLHWVNRYQLPSIEIWEGSIVSMRPSFGGTMAAGAEPAEPHSGLLHWLDRYQAANR
jgi:hypothetical protein